MRTLTLAASMLSLAAVQACMPAGANANPDGSVNTGTQPLMNCSSDFGRSTAGTQLRAFASAVDSFTSQSIELDNTLRTECRAIATDLGASASELSASASMSETQVACQRAAALIRSELTELRGSAGFSLVVESTPPRCNVDVDAYSACAAECDVNYMPGSTQITCEGGELRGSCSANCTGTCAVGASAVCTGSCEGTCTGSCTGSCNGTCEGTCSSRDASGACNGSCTGTCRGTCSAGCTGSCMGQCVTMASARCEGECRGSCSVAFTRPRCTGRAVPPMVDAECRASCDTRVNARAECTRGEVVVRLSGSLSGALQTRSERLRATLESHYGNVASASVRLRALSESGALMLQSAARVPGAVVSLGLAAGACAAEASQSIAVSVPRVQVSFMASVAVTGSVSGGQ